MDERIELSFKLDLLKTRWVICMGLTVIFIMITAGLGLMIARFPINQLTKIEQDAILILGLISCGATIFYASATTCLSTDIGEIGERCATEEREGV